jgi:hypothetical protein
LISLLFDKNSLVFAVRIQRLMKNEQESPSNKTEKGYIRILNFKCCIFASLMIMKGEHTNDAGIMLEVCGPSPW